MKLLLVTSRYPWPARRGDQLRALQLLELLAGTHEPTLLTPAPAAGQPPPPPDLPFRLETYRPGSVALRPFRLLGALLSGLPLQNGLFGSADLRRRLRDLAPAFDRVVLQLVRLAELAPDAGTTPLVVDLIDSLALNVEGRAACDRGWLRPALRFEARRLAAAERHLAEKAERLLVVSERDRADLAGRLPAALAGRVAVVRLAAAAPSPPAPGSVPRPAPPPPTLVFTGNLGYFVNADAITSWLREVWPLLAARAPELRLVIAGDRPGHAVRRAVRQPSAERVTLLASPPDLRSVLGEATVALAPMRCGSGVPVKVLEAWGAGVPVVASPWAAAGTTGLPGRDFLVAGTPEEWVEAVVTLLADGALREEIAAHARRRLAADYSARTVGAQWQAILCP